MSLHNDIMSFRFWGYRGDIRAELKDKNDIMSFRFWGYRGNIRTELQASWCGFSSECSLFAKVAAYRYSEWRGFPYLMNWLNDMCITSIGFKVSLKFPNTHSISKGASSRASNTCANCAFKFKDLDEQVHQNSLVSVYTARTLIISQWLSVQH